MKSRHVPLIGCLVLSLLHGVISTPGVGADTPTLFPYHCDPGQKGVLDLSSYGLIQWCDNHRYGPHPLYPDMSVCHAMSDVKGGIDGEDATLGQWWITSIPANAFVGCEGITELSLQDNSIENIPNSTFTNLTNLTMLNLRFNMISSIDFAFKGLYKLRHLWLAGNRIQYVAEQAFADLRHLKKLGLATNQIWSISPMAFDGLDEVETLWLGGNRLEYIGLSLTVSLLTIGCALPDSAVSPDSDAYSYSHCYF